MAKSPNTKHQTPGKHQAPNTKNGQWRYLRFDVWSFFGVWCMVFGVCAGVFGVCRGAAPFASAEINNPEFFPILPWDPYHGWKQQTHVEKRLNGFESIAECHFNMAGFVLPKDLRACEKLGLGAILLPDDPVFTNFNYFRAWHKLTDQQIEDRIKRIIREGKSSPAVVGYFINDEPGVAEFPALGKAVAAVRKYAPGKLAYINLLPDYATLGAPDRSQLGTTNYTEYLERFVAEVKPQVISYDNYMVLYSHDLKDSGKAASYYQNLLEVRRVAQEHQLPCLNIVCANQIRPATPIPSPANLLFQAWTTLAAGYRGVTWFNYYGPGYKYNAIGPNGEKTLTWTYLKEVNAQVAALASTMSLLTSTGIFFTSPPPVPGLPSLPGSLVEAVSSEASAMVGEFKHRDGGLYVVVVNLSLERSARFMLKTMQPFALAELVSPVSGKPESFESKDGFWLAAGQGVLLKLK
ncbi:MAG: hypothetical protein C5B50_14465 [Verrucomicrobia bacterium]|nr:MAG: hypothetical protein C5B50_14465 [Verrucomicrobiota bacterium]